MKKMAAMALSIALATTTLYGCGAQTDLENVTLETETNPEQTEESKGFKVAMVLTTAGLGDNNYNDMGYNGLVMAKEKYGVEFNYAEPTSVDECSAAIMDFAQDGSYDLIFGLSTESATGIEEASAIYPDQKFVSVDVEIEGDNVCSIIKNQPEQMFLAGVVAGLMTQDQSYEYVNEQKTVGALLGMDVVEKMAAGYAAGAKFFDPEVKVLSSVVGDFSDVNTAKEMSLSMYDQGADIIQNLDGGGIGLWTAAEEKHFYGLGVGASQNAMSEYIVATAGYALSDVICNHIGTLVDGTWEAGVYVSNMKNGEYELITDGASVALNNDILEKVEVAKEWLANSDTELPLSFAEVDAWVEENHWTE